MRRDDKIPDLAAFEGRWQITRVIEDRRAGQTGRFTGAALFTQVAEGLTYEERGQLELGGAVFEAERRYLWRSGAGGIAIYFDDGRFFHDLKTTSAHWCAPDQYEVAYDFAGWPDWRSTWRVAGPRKDYTMETVYTK